MDEEEIGRLRRSRGLHSPDVQNEEVPGFGTVLDRWQAGDPAAKRQARDTVNQWPAPPPRAISGRDEDR